MNIMRPLQMFVLLYLSIENGCGSTTLAPADVTGTAAPPSAKVDMSVAVVKPANTTTAATTTTAPSTITTTTVAPEKAPLKKPNSILLTMPTIDFSRKKADPPPEVVNTCNKQDVCIKGLCMHGQCQTKPCSTEITCICDPGFTGQFCDKSLSQSEPVSTEAGGNLEASIDQTGNNKQHVNGHIPNNAVGLNNASKTSSSSENTVGAEGIRETRVEGSTSSSNGAGPSNGNLDTTGSSGQGVSRQVDTNDLVTSVNGKKSGNKTDINTVDPSNAHELSNESYVKGPEAFVPNENSTMPFRANVREIQENTPSIIRLKSDVVTISTTAVRLTQIGTFEEAQIKSGSVLNDMIDTQIVKPVSNDLPKQADHDINSDINIQSQTGNKEVVTSKDSKVPETTNPGTFPRESLNIEAAGAPKEGLDLSPLLANSEIKITIETVGQTPVNAPDTTQTDGMNESKGKRPDTAGRQSASKSEQTVNSKPVIETTTIRIDVGNEGVKSAEIPVKVEKSSGQSTASNYLHNLKKENKFAASQHLETRHKMASEALSPLLQLMNLFGSEKFYENVSAVKIEIITKNNHTQPPNSKANGSVKQSSNNGKNSG